MRLVFFGSGAFACPALKALADRRHEIAGVFTRPDKPAGRGCGITATPVKRLAREYRLPVYQPDNPNDQATVELLHWLSPDVGVVVAYGHLLSARLFSQPRHGILNVHASLLPAFRGAAPVPHAILAGEDRAGATVFRINDRFDEGDVFGAVEIPIGPADTAVDVLRGLAPLGARLLEEILGQLEGGWLRPAPQSAGQASRAPKFLKSDGHIDWRLCPACIDRMVRGLRPWPLAFTLLPTIRRVQPRAVKPRDLENIPPEHRGRALRIEAERRARKAKPPEIIWLRTNILEVEPIPDIDGDEGPPPPPAPWELRAQRLVPAIRGKDDAPTLTHRLREAVAAAERRWPAPPTLAGEAPPGLILRADPEHGIVVRCGGGSVRLLRLQPENRCAMTSAEFLRGASVKSLMRTR